jgi:tetratricopeptide (TPR) repeat protein
VSAGNLDTWLRQALMTANQLLDAGRIADADRLLRQVVTERPNHPSALHMAGMVAFRAGRATEGKALVERALAIRPDMPDALYNLGIMLVALDYRERAKQVFARVVELRPDHVAAWDYMGNVHCGDGAFDAAIAAYRRALAIAPDGHATIINIAQALSSAGEHAEARVHAQRAIELAPDADVVHAGLGAILLRAGAPEEALAPLARAAELNPSDAKNHINLMFVLHRLARDHDALDACERALVLRPRDNSALHYKAALLALLGRHEQLEKLMPLDRLIQEREIVPPASMGDLASFNRALVEAILAHPTLAAAKIAKATRGGRQTGNLLDGATGALAQLAAIMRREVEDYGKRLAETIDHPIGGPAPAEFDLQSWAIVLDEGGHQLVHFHAPAWVSGVYYAQVPDSIAADRSDHAGWISFGRPMAEFDTSGAMPERWVHPREGKMLLFPGWLGHRTKPFRADRHRISVAFDALPVTRLAAG